MCIRDRHNTQVDSNSTQCLKNVRVCLKLIDLITKLNMFWSHTNYCVIYQASNIQKTWSMPCILLRANLNSYKTRLDCYTVQLVSFYKNYETSSTEISFWNPHKKEEFRNGIKKIITNHSSTWTAISMPRQHQIKVNWIRYSN